MDLIINLCYYKQTKSNMKVKLSDIDFWRDQRGIPHSRIDENLWSRLGFLYAEDRLYQLYVLMQIGNGNISSLYGCDNEKYLLSDKLVQSIKCNAAKYCDLSDEDKRAVKLFVKGINSYIKVLEVCPEKTPVEFNSIGSMPSKIKSSVFATAILNLAYLYYSFPLASLVATSEFLELSRTTNYARELFDKLWVPMTVPTDNSLTPCGVANLVDDRCTGDYLLSLTSDERAKIRRSSNNLIDAYENFSLALLSVGLTVPSDGYVVGVGSQRSLDSTAWVGVGVEGSASGVWEAYLFKGKKSYHLAFTLPPFFLNYIGRPEIELGIVRGQLPTSYLVLRESSSAVPLTQQSGGVTLKAEVTPISSSISIASRTNCYQSHLGLLGLKQSSDGNIKSQIEKKPLRQVKRWIALENQLSFRLIAATCDVTPMESGTYSQFSHRLPIRLMLQDDKSQSISTKLSIVTDSKVSIVTTTKDEDCNQSGQVGESTDCILVSWGQRFGPLSPTTTFNNGVWTKASELQSFVDSYKCLARSDFQAIVCRQRYLRSVVYDPNGVYGPLPSSIWPYAPFTNDDKTFTPQSIANYADKNWLSRNFFGEYLPSGYENERTLSVLTTIMAQGKKCGCFDCGSKCNFGCPCDAPFTWSTQIGNLRFRPDFKFKTGYPIQSTDVVPISTVAFPLISAFTYCESWLMAGDNLTITGIKCEQIYNSTLFAEHQRWLSLCCQTSKCC